MHSISFSRRILPWLYILIFLLTAPFLILYTAGYRYNAKKAQVERNGTLIVDSFPTKADVFIDDKATGEVTPITFQNITPGVHRIRIAKQNYRSWEKSLDVRSELVTFANNVWLLREAKPTFVLPGAIVKATADPAGEKIALVFETASSSCSIAYWTPDNNVSHTATLASLNATSSAIALRWQPDGEALLVNGFGTSDPAWWSRPEKGGAYADLLPSGLYFWEGSELVGSDGVADLNLFSRTKSFTRSLLKPDVVENLNGYTLETNSSTHKMTLTDTSFLTRVFSLPQGQWHFGDLQKPFVILKDGERWLALNPKSSPPFAGQAFGDYPRWLDNKKEPSALIVNGNEVWVWILGQNPTLVWRQSEPIVQAAWHPSGTTIFLASATQVTAIELDERNGRIVTPLAAFDRIWDISFAGKNLSIAATTDNQRGLWMLPVE